MKEEFEPNSCRICLTKTKKLRSLYKPIDEGDEPPNEMLQQITGIQVEQQNEFPMLPKKICKNCELSLSMAFEFRVNAFKTQQMIVGYLKEINRPVTGKETKELKNDCQLDTENVGDNSTVCMQTIMPTLKDNTKHLEGVKETMLEDGEETEAKLNDSQQYMEEDSEFILQDNEQQESSNEDDENYSEHHNYDDEDETNEEEERIDDDYEDDEEESNQEQIKTEQDEDINCKNSKNTNKINEKPWKSQLLKIEKQEPDSESAIKQEENIKPIVRRGRKPIKSANGHICDVCGNVYTKRSRMMEHRQRHVKELRYQCELCDQKFHMRELLRKHMFSHIGGKPLKCEFCSRTFYYESVRRAHEAVHQGHKPFVCDVCDKAFGYAHALKKHKLIHADIKLYHCEFCNKDFRLQHHMKQHNLTRMHQNAVRAAAAAGGIQSANYGDDDGDGDADGIVQDEQQNLSDDLLLVEEINDEPYVGS